MTYRDSNGRFMKGFKHTEESKRKMSLSRIGKQTTLGKHHTEETKLKIKLACLGKINIKEKNGMWKGKDVGISSLHLWVRDHLKQPELCEECSIKPSYDLANVTGIYERDFNNWKYLCRSCHMKLDYKNSIRKPKGWKICQIFA